MHPSSNGSKKHCWHRFRSLGDASLCTLCTTCALGDERHYVFDCPRFAGLRLTHAELFQDASGAMKSLVWHKDQEDVCALLLAIVAQAQT